MSFYRKVTESFSKHVIFLRYNAILMIKAAFERQMKQRQTCRDLVRINHKINTSAITFSCINSK